MMQEKTKITMEYPLNCTVSSLYNKIRTDSGLSSWFADKVEVDDNKFIFWWRKIPQEAVMIGCKENKFVRFQWDDDYGTDCYFEFAIQSYELTGGVSLIVTDFADSDDVESEQSVWDSYIGALKRQLGV